jgi:hypothetical protein
VGRDGAAPGNVRKPEQDIRAEDDPDSPNFWIDSWRQNLMPWAKSHGIGAIRFAMRSWVTDRSVVLDARPAAKHEVEQAAGPMTYPAARFGSLFTDQPTGVPEENV